MRWQSLLMFMPDEFLPLLFIGACVALILGLITGRTVLGILGLIIFLPVLGPIVEGIFGVVPGWVSLVILAVVALSILRGVASLLLGEGAANHMVGSLAADGVRLILIALFLPFRVVGWFFRNISNGRL